MTVVPHDITDLRLAPVALAVDARLESFLDLDRDAIHGRVSIETNSEASSKSERARNVVESVTYLLDLGGWHANLDVRGLALTHGQHRLVLGIPQNLIDYIDEPLT